MLWSSGQFVAKSLASLSYVIRHTKVHFSICIIPIKVDTEEDFAVPVYSACICLGKVGDEVLRIIAAGVFYPEIIDHKTKNIGCVLCWNRLGVRPVGIYPPVLRCWINFLYAMRPAQGSPYMPFFISANNMPP